MFKRSIKILFTLIFTVFINFFGEAQEFPKKTDPIPPIEKPDTSKVKRNIEKPPIKSPDSLNREVDSISMDSIKPKEFLEDIVKYKAKDYISLKQKENRIYLYNEAQVNYQDMEIKAGVIVIDNGKNLVYAGRIKDSTGYQQRPIFTQGSNVVEPDSIIFNTETKKALIFNSSTEQQGFKILAPYTKKENDSVYFIKDAKFTTAEDIDDPEYYFLVRKGKFVPKKKVIAGFTNMYIYDVWTPVMIPFAYFPMTDKQTSGILFPTFGEDTGNDRGYFLQNGGYYFAISDYLDLAVLGDYYTNGSYGLRLESNYAKRYGFSGSVRFRYENLLNSERGFPDFTRNTIYNIIWSHSQDAKSNPSSRFSASVNLGSSNFFRQSINQQNISNSLNNTLASSVSYSKTFQGEPQVNVNLSATHSQNTNTESINMTLPTLQASVGRMFPFAPKTGAKKGIIQNINFQYNTRGEYRINTTDSLFFKSEMFEDARAGMQHSIPITTNFKLFKHFSVSSNVNLEENWTLNTINRSFDAINNEVVTTERNEFDRFLTYNFSSSLGTTLYGDYTFTGKNPKIQAIRHTLRPSISYSITPAFDQYYETYDVIDADGTTSDQVEYTRFENSLFGTPGNNYASNIGVSLGNTLEAKIRPKDSTETEPVKRMLLKNLNISTAYNLAADSLAWSPVRINGGTQILNDKMNINFSATLDPYALDNNNRKINRFNIDNGGSLFRLTSANANISYSLSNETFSGKDDDEDTNTNDNSASRETALNGGRTDGLFGDPMNTNRRREDKDKKKSDDKSKFYNNKMPWSLRLAYAVNYNNTTRQNSISSHSLMFSGDIDLSPKWRVTFNSGYDFLNKGVTFTRLGFERDLLSWRMNFDWVPIGPQTSWNFFIGISAPMLQDLKYEQRRQPDRQLGQ